MVWRVLGRVHTRAWFTLQIDWLDLNSRGDVVLFRDKRRKLHLFDISSQTKSTLLSYATFASWIPQSDVVVAQSRGTMCVWYNVFAPDKMTVRSIKGDIEVRVGFVRVTRASPFHHCSPRRRWSGRRARQRCWWTRASP